ncbi:MAG TPA: YdeI/OmpD-associated family protein [Flavisolibacter sp.]|nr:YdeI/OmpD-associated family protein [Flavisolibacter sp.]
MAASSTAQKLHIKEGYTLLPINAPSNFQKEMEPLPPGVMISAKAKKYNQVHWFVKDRAQMEEELDSVIRLIRDDVVCWIYYPKATSKIQTDLSRDKGWETLRQHKEMQWISLISFNDTWSSFGIRLQTEKEIKKEAIVKEKEVLKYIDPVNKLTFLPEDFAEALQKSSKAEAIFNSLSFTNRKEYLDWIVSAKKKETRATRVSESITRLLNGWKNPSNR